MTETPEEEPQRYVPLSARGNRERDEQFYTLVEGVPEWLEPSLVPWVQRYGLPVTRSVERKLKTRIYRLDNHFESSFDEDKLDVLDAVLRTLSDRGKEERATTGTSGPALEQIVSAADELEEILRDAGSVWRVHRHHPVGLVRRVDETMQALVDRATRPEADASRALARAWAACYGREPDYDKAYSEAVRAVEAVALPALWPNDATGTLGKAIGSWKNSADGLSIASLGSEKVSSGETLLKMMQVLWHNQPRHADRTGAVEHAGAPAAEAAVSLAVILVHWFATPLIPPPL